MNVKKTSVILFSLFSIFGLTSCSLFENIFHGGSNNDFHYKNYYNRDRAERLYKEDKFYIETVYLKTYEGNVYEVPKNEDIPNVTLVSNYDYFYASYKIYNPNKYEVVGLSFPYHVAIGTSETVAVDKITSNTREGDYTIVDALFDKKTSYGGVTTTNKNLEYERDIAVLAKWSDKYYYTRANDEEYKNLFILKYSIVKPDNIEYEIVKKGGYIDQDGIRISKLNTYEEDLDMYGQLPENLYFSEVSYGQSEKYKKIIGASGVMNNSKVLKINKLVLPYNFLVDSFEGIEIANFEFKWNKDTAIDNDNLITHIFSNPYANFDKAYLKESGGCYLKTSEWGDNPAKSQYFCLNELDKAYSGQDIKVNSTTKIIGGRSGIFERQYNSIIIPKSLEYYCRSFFDTYIFDNIYYEGTLEEFKTSKPVEYNNGKPSSKYLDESNPKLYFYSEGEPPFGSPYHFYHYNAQGGIERYVGYEE